MSHIFQAKHLYRTFKEKTALDDVTFDLKPGTVTGLIGRNGSGKTTLIKTMVGLLLPTHGSASTFGTSIEKMSGTELGRVGAVFQDNGLLNWMSVANHLDFARHHHTNWDMQRQVQLLDVLELNPDDNVGSLSPGNAQKLAVMLAVCPRPEFLLLDEPVSAMDPIARDELLSFLLELVRQDDATIVISSHVLVDIERVVDRVLCLDAGKVKHHGDLDDLLESYADWLVTAPAGTDPVALTKGFNEDWILERRGTGRQALLLVKTGANPGQRLSEFKTRHGLEVEVRPANLERIFPNLANSKQEHIV